MKKWVLVLLTMLSVCFPVTAQSDDSVFKKSLSGIEGVVLLLYVDDRVEAQMPIDQLQYDIEHLLSAAGIPILSVSQFATRANSGALLVDVNGQKSTTAELWAIHVKVECQEKSRLERDPSILAGSTAYVTSQTGLAPTSQMPMVRRLLLNMIEVFIESYRKDHAAAASQQ